MVIKYDQLENHPHLTTEIASLLFVEWSNDYQKLTNWDTKEKLQDEWLNGIANDNKKEKWAMVAYNTHTNTTNIDNDIDDDDINNRDNVNKMEFVGVAMVADEDMGMRPDLGPWLAVVFVKKEYRGKGIAKELIRKTLNYAKVKGIKKLYLWTFTENLALYYKQFGFQTVQVKDKHGDREKVFVMACPLDTI